MVCFICNASKHMTMNDTAGYIVSFIAYISSYEAVGFCLSLIMGLCEMNHGVTSVASF